MKFFSALVVISILISMTSCEKQEINTYEEDFETRQVDLSDIQRPGTREIQNVDLSDVDRPGTKGN